MENTVKISTLFDVSYGTKLDFKQMVPTSDTDIDGVCFVSRSSKNLGVVARVKRYKNLNPLPAGSITVALGGTYLLSAFVQERPYYTAQNVAVLVPKAKMSYDTKVFYCICLSKNRFKYSAFGREANRTLRTLDVPTTPPRWLAKVDRSLEETSREPLSKRPASLQGPEWKWFQYEDLFDIKKGERIVNNDLLPGSTPCIRPIEFDNGVDGYISLPPNHDPNTITVSYNGSVGEAFYQPKPYFAVDDINVLYPKFKMNPFLAMFLIPLIRKERFRYNFGRKWHLKRMRKSLIKLPTKSNGEVDWEFMETFIKGLPYSRSLL